MSPARIIILVVALVAGLGAALLAQRPSKEPAPVAKIEAAPTVPVLVAATDIPVGNTVTANDLRWLDWPLASVPNGIIRKDETPEAEQEIIGQVARYATLGAEPIRREKLIKTDGTGFLSAVLPSGKRAVAISTDSRGANTAGGFILPNDRVDVVSTIRSEGSSGSEGYASEVILRNIRVLAIGQNVQERNGEKVVVGETATLEIDPGQVEIVAQAQKTGTLSLALRSLKDAGETTPPGQAENSMTLVRYGVTSKSVKP
ncbi:MULTISPECIES: Flp pilus assembly protein CpaB [Bosea]|jgi:pilus assembly protein CpaB|uniref:Flp pilus assembly protein CpaB n=1 Tax=Bosea TaxID=85413 RepID=UPI00214FC0FA|nr:MULTISPECIES: Flp pilus assembly protein CpaB [Bosea]MCR4523208.1 Flp pilus assembly protein CpaB [Bosea sp. 47.2.35]MDR6830199.1 pilus assembly protein CpaB [Bosea robiniae]MDR6895531.1 pilus assembly protein CpaB [Bosea sp. BE109]MDR7138927.1 pilus assembly protein CpaB [Bosea sp. BE168]MDR7175628.1 pilus assembly protein CpaB [Bosea sp. BE271]